MPSDEEGLRRGILTFGKLAGLTYELALANDSEYCQWTVDNYSMSDIEEGKMKFVDWLSQKDRLKLKRKAEEIAESDEEEPFEDKSVKIVDFGKYVDSEITFEELLDKHPGYCLTLLEKQDNKLGVRPNIRSFLEYVKASGVDLNAKLRYNRKQQRAAASRAPVEHAGFFVPAQRLDHSG